MIVAEIRRLGRAAERVRHSASRTGNFSTPARTLLRFHADTMDLSLADVYRIAHLARLEIDAAHAEEVRAKLAAIFGLIDELTAVDTTGVAPMAHAQDATLPLREDVVSEVDTSDCYQALAPAAEDGLYLVPKVLE